MALKWIKVCFVLKKIKEKFEKIKKYLGQYFDVPTFLLSPFVQHPQSFGNISLRSSYPTDAPLIYSNYFSDPHDMKVLIYALNVIKKAVQGEAFSKFKPKLIGPLPRCDNFDLDSDAYLECASRLVTVPAHHGCGTCKMGKVDDASTVVDSSLRVKGVIRLRVVDASIMPRIVSGNTNAAVIMIAEKAADMIKEAWQNEEGGYQAASSAAVKIYR